MKVQQQSCNDSTSRCIAASLLMLALSAAPASATEAPFGSWQTRLDVDSPLVGRMIDARTGRPLTREEVERRVRKAPVVLLGEVHDNPDHHRIQAELLRAFAKGRAKPPAVVYEMIPTDRDGALEALKGAKKLSANAVFDIVDWDNSGWPSRKVYEPVMKATVEVSGVPVAGGLPKDMVRKIGRKGLSALGRQQLGELKLGPLPPELEKRLEQDIVKSHCNMIPLSAAKAMSPVQRMRDALLAKRTVEAFRRNGSVAVITGNGHARKDRGVPFYLARSDYLPPHAKGAQPLVVRMVEARKEARKVDDLMPEGTKPAELADIVIVTPRAEREDPCESFRRFLDRKKGTEPQGKSGKK